MTKEEQRRSDIYDFLREVIHISHVAELLGIVLHEYEPPATKADCTHYQPASGCFKGDCPFCGAKESFFVCDGNGIFGCEKCESAGTMVDLAGRMLDLDYERACQKILAMTGKALQ